MKMRLMLGVLALTGVVIGAGGIAVAADAEGGKILIKQRYLPGSYEMTIKMDSDQTISANEQTQPAQKMTQTFVIGMDVSQPDAQGVKTMQMVYKRVAQEITAGAMKMAFDNTGPAEGQDPNLAAILRPLTEARIVVKIGPDDQVTSATGLNELWDRVAKDSPQLAPIIQQMRGQMGDEMVKSMISKAGEIFPATPVGPGDEWQPAGKMNVPILGEVQTAQKCKLLKVEPGSAGKVATIQLEGTVTITKATTANMGGTNVTINSMNMKQKGEMRFNLDLGMVESQAMDQDAVVDMTAVAANGQTMKMATTQKMKMDITMKKVTGPAAVPAKPAAAPAGGAAPALAPLK